MQSVCLVNIKPSYLKKAVHSFGISLKYFKRPLSLASFLCFSPFSFLQTSSQTIHIGYAPAHTFELFEIPLRLITSDHQKE